MNFYVFPLLHVLKLQWDLLVRRTGAYFAYLMLREFASHNVKRYCITFSISAVLQDSITHLLCFFFRPFITVSDALEKNHFIVYTSAFLGNWGDASPKHKQLISLEYYKTETWSFSQCYALSSSSSHLQCQNGEASN